MKDQAKRISASELARLSGYSPTTITRLTATGVLQRDDRRRYDPLASLKQIKQHEATRQQGGKRSESPEITAARLRLLELRIERLQFDLDVAAGKLVLRSEVERDAEALGSNIKHVLLRLPARVGAQLGIEAQRLADAAVIEALRELENNPLGEKQNAQPVTSPS